MKFHITLSHTPESCPGTHGGTPSESMDWPALANDAGVQLLSAVACQPVHTVFFVVEATDYQQLYDMLKPAGGFAKADISPVRDLLNP